MKIKKKIINKMALLFDKEHPFSLDYEFEIPIRYKSKLITRLTDMINEDSSYEILVAATRLKFLTNLKLALLFEKFKKLKLVPKDGFHMDEQDAINDTAHYFNNLEMVDAPELQMKPLEGSYNVILKSAIEWKRTLINPMSLVNNTYNGTPTHVYYLGIISEDKMVLVSKTGKSLILVGDTSIDDCKNMLIK